MAYVGTLPYATRPTGVIIPVGEWLPWALFVGVIMLFLVYMVGCDQGATSLIGGHYVHEFVHDGRHLIGAPCH